MKTTVHSSRKNTSWLSKLQHFWQATLTFDRSKVTAIQAIGPTIVFVLPLAIGVASNHVAEGVSIASGTVLLGRIGISSPPPIRIHTLLLSCVGIALSAFVGSLTGHISWLAVLIAGVWGIGAGSMGVLGQSATSAGIVSTLILIIISFFSLTPLQALLQAGLMFSGTLMQVLVLLLPSLQRRPSPQRTALARLYQTLSHNALDPTDEQNSERIRDALSRAYSTISEGNRRSREENMLVGLLEEAEGVQLSLLVLARLLQHLSQETTQQTNDATSIRQILQMVANQLQVIAHILTISSAHIPAKTTSQLKEHLQPLQKLLKDLRGQENSSHDEETIRHIVLYGNALCVQLQKVSFILAEREQGQSNPPLLLFIARPRYLHIHNAAEILRANLSFQSIAFRYAMRLGIALALATALYRIFDLSIQRGSWVVLAALLVLQPYFKTTLTRSITYALGTITGAVLTTLLVTTLNPSNNLLVIFATFAVYITTSVTLANYALATAFTTMTTVFILTFIVHQPLELIADRAIDTVIGSVLALLMYILWPIRTRTHTPHFLEDELHAVQQFLVAVLRAYADHDTSTIHMLNALLREARLARSNAQEALQQSQSKTEAAEGVVGAMDVLIRSGLVLEAYLRHNPSGHTLPTITHFAEKVDEALSTLATALHTRQKVATLPDVRQAFRLLKETSVPLTLQAADTNLSIVRAEAKQIIRTLYTLYELLP